MFMFPDLDLAYCLFIYGDLPQQITIRGLRQQNGVESTMEYKKQTIGQFGESYISMTRPDYLCSCIKYVWPQSNHPNHF